MKIEKINIYPITLPFATEFAHALRDRSSVSNIIVELIADSGNLKGYGEGAPRTYVTGETQKNTIETIAAFSQQKHFPWHLHSAAQIWEFADSLPDEKMSNAAICALETALWDVLGKYQQQPVSAYFSKEHYTSQIEYGAAIPLAKSRRIIAICQFAKHLNISKLKLKLCSNYDENRCMFEALHSVFGDAYDLKIDVNGVWDYETALQHRDLIRKYNVKVVEQPMPPGDPGLSAFAEILKEDGIAVMADESVCALADAEAMIAAGDYDMVNVRLSKCGGLVKSWQLIDYLRKHDISFQIGCHLGESGLLSAAGRTLSLLCKDAKYYDGSYDSFLLKENITRQHVSFEKGGKAGPLPGAGWGVEVDPKSLKRLSRPDGPVSITQPDVRANRQAIPSPCLKTVRA